MVTYLRKYESSITINRQAGENAKESTLLDRFFMICLGNLTSEQYKATHLSVKDVELLLLDYYMIFIENPQKSFAHKVAKFVEMEEEFKSQQPVSVKAFSEKFRQHFPHVQKYLKDYYMAKFHAGKK